MLGFVVVDHQADSPETAVWLTSRATDSLTNHSNAVLLQRDDPTYDRDLRSLMADRVLVLTEGSVPPDQATRSIYLSDFADLVAETLGQQQRIDSAVDQARTKSRKLVDPRYPSTPDTSPPDAEGAVPRALATANRIALCWDFWLETERQRVIRAVPPASSKAPPIMPPGLDDPAIAEYPPGFLSAIRPEPMPTGGR